MRYGRKGMASIIDAFMFITIIGLIAAGIFAASGVNVEKEETAKTAYDSFFDIRLRTNDMFDDADTQSVRMCDLIAAYMVTGEGGIPEYAKTALKSIIPPICGYSLVIEYNGMRFMIGDGGDKLTSRYSSELLISDGRTMIATLSLY
ncbi:MAG: hypothetical protein FWD81_05455 [Methanomassiliicoccaceae archaeon]|nr:hypothetical protein [Methanomassiliicoccaceae archaeon]